MIELQLLIKPVSSACNLNCRYCFYKDEAAKRAVADHGKMSEETMSAIVGENACSSTDLCVRLPGGGADTGRSVFL